MNDEMRRNQAQPDATNSAREDAELESLFTAFDQVKADDALKESALAAIFAAADVPDQGEQPHGAADEATSPSVIPFADAQKRAKHVRRHPVRTAAFRMSRVAVAACVALAVGGGVAYATPSAQASVEEGGTVITLDVNVFGMTIGQHASDAAGQEMLDGLDLLNRGYQDSLDDVVGAFDKRAGGEGGADVHIGVEGGFGPQHDQMREDAKHRMDSRPALTADALQTQPDQGPVALGQPGAPESDQGPVALGQTGDAPDAPTGESGPAEGGEAQGQPVSAPDGAPAPEGQGPHAGA